MTKPRSDASFLSPSQSLTQTFKRTTNLMGVQKNWASMGSYTHQMTPIARRL